MSSDMVLGLWSLVLGILRDDAIIVIAISGSWGVELMFNKNGLGSLVFGLRDFKR